MPPVRNSAKSGGHKGGSWLAWRISRPDRGQSPSPAGAAAAKRARRRLGLPLPRADLAGVFARALVTAGDRAPRALVASFLLAFRRERDLSAGQLARRVGVDRRTVQRWEAGRLPALSPLQRRRVVLLAREASEGAVMIDSLLGGRALDPDDARAVALFRLTVASALDAGALDPTKESSWRALAAASFALDPTAITGPSRKARLVNARRVLAVVMRDHGQSFGMIGRAIGRDESTARHHAYGFAGLGRGRAAWN